MKPPHFHLWLPEIFGFKGGIQAYSAFFLEAIQSLYPQASYDVFLKHDPQPGGNSPYLSQTRFHCTGKLPLSVRTPAFAATLVAQGLWQKPDLVIATHLNFTPAASWLKRIAGIPYWTAAHGFEAWDITDPARKAALCQADRVLAVSNFTRDRLLTQQNLDPQKVVLLADTFDLARFEIREKPQYLLARHGLNAEQPIILTVNRLASGESYRGYDLILAALPQIRQAIPDIHYIIVGKGSDRPRLERSIVEQQLQDCVTLAGFVPDSELCDYYNLCDLYAMPSKLEGFGIVYLEALACGKPVLGGDRDGAVDALCHGELGALVDPDDAGAIAQTIIQILQKTYPNPLMYQPAALRQKAIATYGPENFQRQLAQHLEAFFQPAKSE